MNKVKQMEGLAFELLLVAMCLIPAVSHLFALPLYQLNPMLLLLLVGLGFASQQSRGEQLVNGLLFALILPLLSCSIVGMPTITKAFCMMAEFATVVLMMHVLPSAHTTWATLGRTLLALLVAKGVYYLLKVLLIGSVALVSTPIAIQALSMLAGALVYLIIVRKK